MLSLAFLSTGGKAVKVVLGGWKGCGWDWFGLRCRLNRWLRECWGCWIGLNVVSVNVFAVLGCLVTITVFDVVIVVTGGHLFGDGNQIDVAGGAMRER